jgi:tRNA pseudouridine38-40 synthase
MVYRLILSYCGAHYAGWQRQTNAVAVQQVVEEALSDLLDQAVRIVGAGRTDAGVHARGQAASFEMDRAFPLRGLVFGTNSLLPEDVRVVGASRMAEGFHARRCAASKEYRYRLRRVPVLSALDREYWVQVQRDIDVQAMSRACGHLVGDHDFSAFARSGGSFRSPVRRILAAEWMDEGEELIFRVVGQGFLRGMVRALVGTLLEVGRGRRTPEGFGELLCGRPRGSAGPTAPARGLTLERVCYPTEWSPLKEIRW